MSFKHKLIKYIFCILLVIIVTECINSDKKILMQFSKNGNLIPVKKTTQNKREIKKTHSLILFVEDGECPMCLAELELWYDLLNKNLSQQIQYYIIFRKCSEEMLIYNLDIIGINENIYWDNNGVLEEEIGNNLLNNTIFVDKDFQVIKSFDRTQLSENEITEKIYEIKKMYLHSESI